jgi:hypothetical protein
MEILDYDWYKDALSISNFKDRISYLEEKIMDLENDYDDLCDRNTEIANDLLHLSDSRVENNRDYLVLKRKEADIQKMLKYARIEQNHLNQFYSEQFQKFELENEFTKPPERQETVKYPGRLLSTKEKLYLLELLKNYHLLFPLTKRKNLIIALSLITGIKKASLEDDLKVFPGWFSTSGKNQFHTDSRIKSITKIKEVLLKNDYTEKTILEALDNDLRSLELL